MIVTVQLRRSTALLRTNAHARPSDIRSTSVHVGTLAPPSSPEGGCGDEETWIPYTSGVSFNEWTADYELGYEWGFKAARAGKKYDTAGISDAPGRSCAAYKFGYGKGYPAGQYAKAKAEAKPLPPLDPKMKIDPANPEEPPALPLPPPGTPGTGDDTPKLGDTPLPSKSSGGFGIAVVALLVVAVGAGLYVATGGM